MENNSEFQVKFEELYKQLESIDDYSLPSILHLIGFIMGIVIASDYRLPRGPGLNNILTLIENKLNTIDRYEAFIHDEQIITAAKNNIEYLRKKCV
jgi:hypothetical protein